MNVTPRRIVTALDDEGRSYLARVEELPASTRGPDDVDLEALRVAYPRWADGERPDVRAVWGCEELPFELPWRPDEIPSGAHPHELGIRVSVSIYPPGWVGEMFWSNRVDILWVMSGELTYITDGGDEIVVRPGDIVIQNGTNKAFENRGDVPVYMGGVLCGAVRVGPTPPHDRYHGRRHDLERILFEQRNWKRPAQGRKEG